MIKVVFLLFITEIFTLLVGLLFFHFIEKQFPKFHFSLNNYSIPLISIIGLAFFGFFAQFTNLFLPINVYVIFGFLFLIGLMSFLHRQWIVNVFSSFQWQSNKKNLILYGLLFLVFFFIILESAIDMNAISDDGLYHIQSSMWISTYPTVPGLAFIHDRFGFNSIWEPLSTLIGFKFLNSNHEFYFIATPLLAINMIAYLLVELQRKTSVFYKFSCTLLLTAFLYLAALYDLGTIKNDLPSTFLVWISFLFFIRIIETNHYSTFEPVVWNIMLVIISLFAVLTKVSVLFIFILPLFSILYTRNFSKIFQKVSLISLFLAPMLTWVIRSVLLSGYFLYPPFHPQFGLPLPWLLPYNRAKNAGEWIISWARYPRMSKDKVLAMKFWEWFPHWLTIRLKPDLLFIGLGVIAILFLFVALFLTIRKKRKTVQELLPYSGLLVWSMISLAYWFAMAPVPRFYYGMLFPTIATIAFSFKLILPEQLWKIFSTLIKKFHVAAIIIVLMLGFIVSDNYRDGLSGHLVESACYPQHSTEKIIINGIEFSISDPDTQCWGEKLPCTPYPPFHIKNFGTDYRPVFYEE